MVSIYSYIQIGIIFIVSVSLHEFAHWSDLVEGDLCKLILATIKSPIEMNWLLP